MQFIQTNLYLIRLQEIYNDSNFSDFPHFSKFQIHERTNEQINEFLSTFWDLEITKPRAGLTNRQINDKCLGPVKQRAWTILLKIINNIQFIY